MFRKFPGGPSNEEVLGWGGAPFSHPLLAPIVVIFGNFLVISGDFGCFFVFLGGLVVSLDLLWASLGPRWGGGLRTPVREGGFCDLW